MRYVETNLAVFTDCLPKAIKRAPDGSCTLSSLENRVRCAYYLPVAYVKRMALKAAERQAESVEHTQGWTWTMCHHLLKMGARYEKGRVHSVACQGPGLYQHNCLLHVRTQCFGS